MAIKSDFRVAYDYNTSTVVFLVSPPDDDDMEMRLDFDVNVAIEVAKSIVSICVAAQTAEAQAAHAIDEIKKGPQS